MIARENIRRILFAAVCLATFAAGGAPEAVAATSCNTTKVVANGDPGVTSGVFQLQDDYTTTNDNGACFDMRDGIDLDLNGHSITCTDAACGRAVTCGAANSRIRSSVSNDGGHVDITGPFAIGIENCTDHDELVIDGVPIAISSNRLDTVTNSVLLNCSTTCIVATMTSSTDRIHDNLIKPYGGDGISVVGKSSATGPKIDHNLFMKFDVAMYNNDSTYVRIEDNVIADGVGSNDAFDISLVNKSLTNNVCESDALCAVHFSTDSPTTTVLY